MENLKRHAYENLGDLVPIDEPPVFGPGVVPASLQPVNFGDLFPIDEPPVFRPGMVPASLQSVNLPGVHQGKRITFFFPGLDFRIRLLTERIV